MGWKCLLGLNKTLQKDTTFWEWSTKIKLINQMMSQDNIMRTMNSYLIMKTNMKINILTSNKISLKSNTKASSLKSKIKQDTSSIITLNKVKLTSHKTLKLNFNQSRKHKKHNLNKPSVWQNNNSFNSFHEFISHSLKLVIDWKMNYYLFFLKLFSLKIDYLMIRHESYDLIF